MAGRTRWLASLAVAVLALGAPATAQANEVDDVVRKVQQLVGDVGGPVRVDAIDGVMKDVDGIVAMGQQFTFPPPGFVTTSITWAMEPGDLTPTFTPPNPATSHPSNWSCTTSTTATTAHASCTPTSAYDPGTSGWYCYDPFVVVDVESPVGTGGDAVTGVAHCGTTYASCTANTALGATTGTTTFATSSVAAHCQDAAFPHQPAPLECDADFGAAKPTATWTVRCAPVDP